MTRRSTGFGGLASIAGRPARPARAAGLNLSRPVAVSTGYPAAVAGLLARAGIELNGTRPWDITVRDQRFFKRALAGGAIGLGESYMDGWWDCEALDAAFERILTADIRREVRLSPGLLADAAAENLANLPYVLPGLRPFLARFASHAATAETHYDVGNELYQAILDPRMVYSCGYWAGAENFEAAQEAKLQLACEKLGLRPGHRVVGIGCGSGGFSKEAAQARGGSALRASSSAGTPTRCPQRDARLPPPTHRQ